MESNRRDFLALVGLAGLGTAVGAEAAAPARDGNQAMGVLVDTTYCVGCRKCEWACREANGLPNQPLERYENAARLPGARRPDAGAFTVVNAYANGEAYPHFVKFQCMHCLEPACASACIVGALRREPAGPVSYDAGKCIGCRYCMVACPFQVPAYEYGEALAPRVMKCGFCFQRTVVQGERPACVQMCPEGCLIFGRRGELLAYGHRRIKEQPGRYMDHIFGEREVGGTSFVYLSSLPMAQLGFPALPDAPPAHATERVQHALFKGFYPPLALYALLGGVMWLSRDTTETPRKERP